MSWPRLVCDSAVAAAPAYGRALFFASSAQSLRVHTQARSVCNRMFLEARCTSRRLRRFGIGRSRPALLARNVMGAFML